MDTAITVGMVLWVFLAVVGVIGVGASLLFLVWLFNPFRTGH